jgi:hypothetical protein
MPLCPNAIRKFITIDFGQANIKQCHVVLSGLACRQLHPNHATITPSRAVVAMPGASLAAAIGRTTINIFEVNPTTPVEAYAREPSTSVNRHDHTQSVFYEFLSERR